MSRDGENNGASWETSTIIHMNDDYNSNSSNGMTWLYFRYILKVEPRVFVGGMDVCCKRKKRIKGDSVGLNK